MQKLIKTTNPDWTILKLLNWTTSFFKSHHIDSSRAAAEILLAHTLKIKRIDLYLQYDQPLNADELSDFKVLIKRRAAREPVAYITGTKEFWGLDMCVTGDVLIPRPETEILVETALACIPDASETGSPGAPYMILELGTGSGAVIISIASEREAPTCFASDISVKAVEIAIRNAGYHGLEKKIHFFSGDWLKPVNSSGPMFHMIISNPPYIKCGDIDQLQPEICRFEPVRALDGSEDGLYCIRRIIGTAHRFLHDHGTLIMEIGHDQRDCVEEIAMEDGHYEAVSFVKDYSGFDRVVQMKKKLLRT